MSLDSFRSETRAWLEQNCPPGARGPGEVSNGSTKIKIKDTDTLLWLERMKGSSIRIGEPDRLSMWKDLLIRMEEQGQSPWLNIP